jgi:hypothetical protein
MNIFFLDEDPRSCAESHYDKHVVKMIVEYAQLLSTAHRVLDGIREGRMNYRLADHELDALLYKVTHVNHPSAVWVRESDGNYLWLHSLLEHLLDEYQHRYGKPHSTSRLMNALAVAPSNIKTGEFYPPPAVMEEEFVIPHDCIASYRNYYARGKERLLGYRRRQPPGWLREEDPKEIR